MSDINTRITFQQVNETEMNVLEDGKIVGSIWSYSENKDHYPYTEEEGYDAHPATKREELQIRGFTKASVVWDCGIFKKKKDLVVTFNESAIQDNFSKDILFHEIREYCKEHQQKSMINIDELIKFISIKLSKPQKKI